MIRKLKRAIARFVLSGVANPEKWLVEWTHGGESSGDSAVTVNDSTVLTHGPVWQAVSIIAGDAGQLPLRVMKRDSSGKKDKDRQHAGYRLLSREPNQLMNPSTFKELMQQWALLWGNAVAVIVRQGSTPVELVPLLPDRTEIDFDAEEGQLWYLSRIGDEAVPRRFLPEEVIHIKGLSQDGLWGLSVIEQMANTVGLGMSLTKHGNKQFSNGARLSGIIKRPADAGNWTPDARQRLRKEWKEMHHGLDASECVAVLQDGMEFQPMSISNIDAQWLEGMRLTREQTAAFFCIPPYKLGALENSSVRANLEEQGRDYLNSTLMKWLIKWEEELNRKLLKPQEFDNETHYFKWKVDAILRGSTKERYEAYMIGRAGGWLSPNDILDLEDMNRRDDPEGDEYGNPNTSSGSPAKEDPPTEKEGEEEEEDRKGDSKPFKNLLEDRCKQMITVEANKVQRACKKPTTFMEWCDGFYDTYKQFGQTFIHHAGETCRAGGFALEDVDRALAEHATKSKQALALTVAGCVDEEQIPEKITALASSWVDYRGEGLAEELWGDHE